MHYGHVPGIAPPVSRLVQGTPMLGLARLDEGFDLLDQVAEHGCSAFDTARTYNLGESEQVLGRWIEARDCRENVVIVSKGGHPREGRARVTPADITDDLMESLRQLRVDRIDLYLIHRDDPSVPVGPIVDFLNQHAEEGRIGAFGASNWSYERVREANSYAAATGQRPFVASSPHFSLAVPHVPPWPGCVSVAGADQAEARSWYRQTNLPLLTWSSLSGGFFTGRFRRGAGLDQFDDPADLRVVSSYCHESNFERLDRAEQLAGEKGVTAAQVAISYVLNAPMNVFALVGCLSGTEFGELSKAAELPLTPEELSWLETGERTHTD